MTQDIAVFYHIWAPECPAVWKLLVDEQIKRLQHSGLPGSADVFACISGAACEEALEFVKPYGWLEILDAVPANECYEGLTLTRLHRHAISHAVKAVGYLHTKGLSHLLSADNNSDAIRCANSWRHAMEMVILDRWRDAAGLAKSFNVVAPIFGTEPFPHSRGNFWWANGDYVRKLPPPLSDPYPETSAFENYPKFGARFRYEAWVGLNNPRAFSFCHDIIKHKGVEIRPVSDFQLVWDDIGPYFQSNIKQIVR